jgi:cullin-associated NEDD8-dissociated protein 1
VTPLLFARAESTDEESRTVVASCLGRLAIIDPAKVLPALRNLLKSKNEALREVVIVALRSSFQPGADWAYLTDAFEDFFALLKDPSLNVRHQAVLTVSALLREKPSAVSRSLLDTVFLPALFAETEVHAEYVRIVDYGNFKESEDLALPLRKATFECLASLLLDFSEQINMQVGANNTKT